MRILFVEDDAKLRNIISAHLKSERYVVDGVGSVAEAKAKIKKTELFDLIILDVNLPDGNGVDLCRSTRADDIHTPVLMLTSRSSTVDKISGLDAGADDYIPKPFSPNELSARMRALLRRPQQNIGEVIGCGDITLNMLSRTVKADDEKLDLMPKEFSLLEYLIRHKNEAVRKDELLRNVWGVYTNTSSNRLEVYIRYLREKLEGNVSGVSIVTIRGTGYMITDEA